MGRVSRIIKAVRDNPPSELESSLAGVSPAPAVPPLPPSDIDLPRVMANWTHMPDHFKRTIMTLVEIVEARRGESRSS
ncbi:MAG: hypothetical protein K2R98_09550 [Gemmataceae bacterium]|nr:hypothetical protein [Gemmataceae bacterium]